MCGCYRLQKALDNEDWRNARDFPAGSPDKTSATRILFSDISSCPSVADGIDQPEVAAGTTIRRHIADGNPTDYVVVFVDEGQRVAAHGFLEEFKNSHAFAP